MRDPSPAPLPERVLPCLDAIAQAIAQDPLGEVPPKLLEQLAQMDTEEAGLWQKAVYGYETPAALYLSERVHHYDSELYWRKLHPIVFGKPRRSESWDEIIFHGVVGTQEIAGLPNPQDELYRLIPGMLRRYRIHIQVGKTTTIECRPITDKSALLLRKRQNVAAWWGDVPDNDKP